MCVDLVNSSYLYFVVTFFVISRLFIGSDNDDADPTSNDDVNKNELVSDGLNRYRLEWPLAWASDSTGAYSASILPKFHTFDEIGEYQLCFANTWSSFSNANFKGTVRLVGLQRCESLVCTPGDRGYCSDRGERVFQPPHFSLLHTSIFKEFEVVD